MTDDAKRAPGRPTTFNEKVAQLILGLAAQGLTDAQISKKINVPAKTFRNWKAQNPEFRDTLKEAKDVADEMVVASLFQRAVGYSLPAVKIFCDEGTVVTHRYTERYPPDTTACIFWLKNRQPEKWRDRQEHDVELKNAPQVVITLPSNGREAPANDDE